MTDIQEQDTTEADLAKIGSLHRWLTGILITYLPVVVCLFLMRLPEWLILTGCLAWVCAGSVTAFMIGFSRCPACGQFFHVRGGGSLFAKKCLHCGIRLH
jgi:hypothetical protein